MEKLTLHISKSASGLVWQLLSFTDCYMYVYHFTTFDSTDIIGYAQLDIPDDVFLYDIAF